MAEDVLDGFFTDFFTPKYLNDFHTPFLPVKIIYFRGADTSPSSFTLTPYPFQTLYDLKVMIYQHFRKEAAAHPMFQSLLVPFLVEEERNEAPAVEYTSFEYAWTESGETIQAFQLIAPFERVGGDAVDTQFVSESGKRTLQYANRSRMTLEDFTRQIIQEEKQMVLHLYLYKDVISLMKADLRTSEREWFGRISPYYPEVPINQPPTTVPADQLTHVKMFEEYVQTMTKQVSNLETLLQSETVALQRMNVVGCKFLRLVWKEPEEETPSLETLFYQLNATTNRPFMRILPASSTPITKLKMEGPSLKIPSISDPRLLLTWKDERNPKPDKDYLFSKVIIRDKVGAQPELYGTLRLYHDRSADFIIMPPKQLRYLDPRVDLNAVGSLLTKGFQGMPFEGAIPDIGEASFVCAMRLPQNVKPLPSSVLRERLSLFRSLFQEIPPLPGDKPLLMLRYRAVSNYALEDRIYTFLTLMVSRTLARGEAALPELVVFVQKEFQLSLEEAQSKVSYWLRNRGEIQLAVPETKDYLMTYNPGIDIAIFGQLSYYTIHLYRVDSIQVFQRIITALSLLLSAKDKDLGVTEATLRSAQSVAAAVDAVAVATPGADAVVAERARATVGEVPENAEEAEEDAENALGSANNMDAMYARLMMGVPGDEEGEAEAEAEGGEEEEVFNLGDPKQALNAAAEVRENTRAAAAAVAASERRELGHAPAAAAAAAAVESNDEEDSAAGKKKTSYQGWVKSQLQAADQRLFMYKTDVAGRKIKKYVTMCQATESRQPYVLNEEQYRDMKTRYETDEKVVFVTYGWDEKEIHPHPGDEVYTLLKYGTDPRKPNYYLCCQFFCMKDYILVREKDFYSTTDRQGNPKVGETAPGKKDRGSCPFCGGLEIKVLKSPKPKETVIQRRSKKAESKRHLYVSFLQGETQHPEEFYMPCCFTEDTKILSSDPRFDKIRGESDEKEEEEVRTVSGVPTTSYQVTLYRAHKKYIVGPEKEYLRISEIDGPQVGLLLPVLDRYFGQDPKEFVSREANKMELLPNANCFLRVGVENRFAYRYDSFFAALAPYLEFRNSASAVKARIEEVITPRIFTMLNYGNLVLEFYDPGDPGPKREDLRFWASRQLQIDLNDSNQDAAMRIWKSYHHFLGFLQSDKPKEYRQFAQMLALPGVVTPRGLVLIVLDLNEKDQLTVRCPPFGYNIEQYSSSDFAFILHRTSGIWEPIFYSSNRSQTSKFKARHQPEITFQRSLEAGWPSIVKQRVSEFSRQCYSIGRGAYTSSRKIDPMVLVPLSRAIQAMPQPPTGIVRDAYNHIAAITFRAVPGKPGLVALPVIDDEFLPLTGVLHLDWDDYTPAPLDLIVKFYRANFEDIFALYPGYSPKRRIKSRGTEKYVAVQLANGLFVPAAAPKDEASILSLPLAYIDEMEWSLNREIIFSKDEKPSEDTLRLASEVDMREIFEHLRLTFSNWFGSESVSPDFRQTIKKIIDSRDLPLFERRKRLEILLGSTLLSWMDSETAVGEQEPSLLRVDCRLRAEATCSGKCVWRQAAGEAVGRCYLHSPTQFHLGGRRVNGTRLLMLRLLEELLRFPERKQQLLTGKVSTLVSLKDAVRIGDQYVLPEGSVAWHDLLRLDWIESGKEMKKYYEEMSRKEGAENEGVNNAERAVLESEALPESLTTLFGKDDPKTKSFVLLKAPVREGLSALNPFLVPLGTSAGELGMPETSSTLDRDALKRLTLLTRRPILYIDTIFDPPEVLAFGVLRKQKTPLPFILVNTEDGPRLLSSSKRGVQEIRSEAMPKGLLALYEDRVGITE